MVDNIPKIIGPNQDKILFAIPSVDEIKKVVFSFQGDKALSPDGFPIFFFQEYWHIVGADTTNIVKELFGSRRILKEINSTFIALIPKVVGPDSMGNFRPISLCNSFYKIISKVLTSRLLAILPLVIFEEQKGFVLGRQILDSTILVHENIHSLNAANKEGFLIKLDLAKAYDRVEWQVLLGSWRPLDLMRRLLKSLES